MGLTVFLNIRFLMISFVRGSEMLTIAERENEVRRGLIHQLKFAYS